MEREYKTRDFSKYQIFLSGDKKLIKTIESTQWHTTMVYWIPPSGRNNLRRCDRCSQEAEFLYFDKDHEKRYSIYLFCGGDAYPDFQKWLNEEK